ncbi:MAG: hypothetical protein JJD92_00050 [Frankiaceae bacterium]|nr:hypothetical protein [Frankiaceae bacterium]
MSSDLLSVDQLAERLGCAPDEALALVRRVGPRGVVRTNDRRLLVPSGAVDELRAAVAAEQLRSARRRDLGRPALPPCQGLDVSRNGRIPSPVVAAYRAAHPC